jgi:hypothetical protein
MAIGSNVGNGEGRLLRGNGCGGGLGSGRFVRVRAFTAGSIAQV